MLVITPYGLRFLDSDVGPSLGTIACFSNPERVRAEQLLTVLRSPSCRSSLKNWFPPNGSYSPEIWFPPNGSYSPEISCQSANDQLIRLLRLPKCDGMAEREYLQAVFDIIRTILQENLGSESLRFEALLLSGSPRPPLPPPPGGGGSGIQDFLGRYGIYIALGLAAVILLSKR
jgi:hypothetical protein